MRLAYQMIAVPMGASLTVMDYAHQIQDNMWNCYNDLYWWVLQRA